MGSAPRPQSRHPPGNVSLIETVLLPETVFEAGLFEARNVELVERKKEQEPAKHRQRAEQRRLAEEDGQDAADHWVAHVPVRPAHDDMLRGIPRRERPLADVGQQLHRPAEQTRPKPMSNAASKKGRNERAAGSSQPGCMALKKNTISPGMTTVAVNGNRATAPAWRKALMCVAYPARQ